MDKKELRLKAEQRLFEAASRYFEEPDCVEKAQAKQLDEKVLVDPDTGKKYDIDDEYLYNATLAAGETKDEFGVTNDATIPADDAIAYTFKSNVANAARAAAREKIEQTDNETFNQLVPKIEKFLTGYVKKAVEKGAIKSVGKGHWEIPQACVKDANDNVWKYVIDPAYRAVIQNQGKKAAADFRRGWVKYSGFGTGLNGLKDAMMDALYVKESAFFKAMNKALNETLTSMYSEKYNVCLSEANNMFIVNDVIAE